MRLLDSSVRSAVRSQRCAHRRPIRSSLNLHEVEARLATASVRLSRAAQALAETRACIAREPERAGEAPELLVRATARWIMTARQLDQAANEVFALHEEVLDGLASGTLVPEPPAARRPRIILAPRPVPVRAFLAARQPRVTDRISPLLQRRRRTPGPAALSVPPPTSQGRAPPFSPICPF